MRAVSHAFVFVFLLTGNVDIAPTSTGRQNHALGTQDSPIGHFNLNQPPRLRGRNDFFCTLQIHDVDLIVTHLRL